MVNTALASYFLFIFDDVTRVGFLVSVVVVVVFELELFDEAGPYLGAFTMPITRGIIPLLPLSNTMLEMRKYPVCFDNPTKPFVGF